MLTERNHFRQEGSSQDTVHITTEEIVACQKYLQRKMVITATTAVMVTFELTDNVRRTDFHYGIHCSISLTVPEGMVVKMHYVVLNATCNDFKLKLTDSRGKLFHLCRNKKDVFPPQLNNALRVDHFPGEGFPVVYSNTNRLTFFLWSTTDTNQSLAAKVSFSTLPASGKPQLEVLRLSPSRGEL